VDGDQAYELVRAYARIGAHRTGSSGDERTVHWLARELSVGGAEVELRPYSFNRFDAAAEVEVFGRPVEAIPLYYSAVGDFALKSPAVAEIDAHEDDKHLTVRLRQLRDRVKKDSDGLVLATRCPTDELCALNRSEGDFLDFPTILIAGFERKSVHAGSLINFAASMGAGKSSNILARFSHSAAGRRSAIVTTPLSGWFSCAGERGCGIAVALHVATQLSRFLPVTLLATTGHEIGFIGGYELGKNFDEDPEFIIHIGACIANRATELTAVCSANRPVAENVSSTLAPIEVRLRAPEVPGDPNSWIGESKCWAFRNRPMLSIAGLAPQFHTRGDLPELTTSPALLQESLRAIGDAACALAQSICS
jgi:hypothetical protein